MLTEQLRGLMWFREDLRINDNMALYHATQICQAGIIALYVIDLSWWRQHQVAACRIEFILRGLKILSEDLAQLNVPLLILSLEGYAALEHAVADLVKKANINAVFFNRQYEINEQRRDAKIQNYLSKKNIRCYSYDDQVILPPGSIVTQQGEMYKVFTAYKRAWQQQLCQHPIALLPRPLAQENFLGFTVTPVPTSLNGFSSSVPADLWPAGEHAAWHRLEKFCEEKIMRYQQQRDFPALNGTSQLSPYLASGMLSPRQSFHLALSLNQGELTTGNPGIMTWLNELIWRDFYKHILVAVPRVSMHKAYQPATEKIAWRYDETALLAWQQGQTGYPLVDAAMRQLKQLGWMHNRLRMVVAMFFSKNLLLDWRLGESYFMSQLIDGDLAANNGGWQWCASTGCDAAPYFRLFNPVKQSERFDPDGEFIRHYCPELAPLDNHAIHDPYHRAPLLTKNLGYPAPIVDFAKSRERVLNAFKAIR